MFAPNSAAQASNGSESLSLSSGSNFLKRNSDIDPVNNSASAAEDDGKNLTSGHSLRRGIFSFQQGQSILQQSSKPATINIQIPDKLPFNPFNLFNMDTLKSLVQSVTENFTGNKKAYSTGFDDSVTIISEDPEKPSPRAINPPMQNNNPNSNSNENNHINANNRFQSKEVIPFVKQPAVQFQPPLLPSSQGQHQPKPSNSANDVNKYNYNQPQLSHNGNIENKYHKVQMSPQLSPQPGLLTEESMINKQMETLNEVLTHEMNHKDHHSTTSAPLTFPFLPDLSALSQLFNWGEQGARTLAVCNACRVGFGLFVSRVSPKSSVSLLNFMIIAMIV